MEQTPTKSQVLRSDLRAVSQSKLDDSLISSGEAQFLAVSPDDPAYYDGVLKWYFTQDPLSEQLIEGYHATLAPRAGLSRSEAIKTIAASEIRGANISRHAAAILAVQAAYPELFLDSQVDNRWELLNEIFRNDYQDTMLAHAQLKVPNAVDFNWDEQFDIRQWGGVNGWTAWWGAQKAVERGIDATSARLLLAASDLLFHAYSCGSNAYSLDKSSTSIEQFADDAEYAQQIVDALAAQLPIDTTAALDFNAKTSPLDAELTAELRIDSTRLLLISDCLATGKEIPTTEDGTWTKEDVLLDMTSKIKRIFIDSGALRDKSQRDLVIGKLHEVMTVLDVWMMIFSDPEKYGCAIQPALLRQDSPQTGATFYRRGSDIMMIARSSKQQVSYLAQLKSSAVESEKEAIRPYHPNITVFHEQLNFGARDYNPGWLVKKLRAYDNILKTRFSGNADDIVKSLATSCAQQSVDQIIRLRDQENAEQALHQKVSAEMLANVMAVMPVQYLADETKAVAQRGLAHKSRNRRKMTKESRRRNRIR